MLGCPGFFLCQLAAMWLVSIGHYTEIPFWSLNLNLHELLFSKILLKTTKRLSFFFFFSLKVGSLKLRGRSPTVEGKLEEGVPIII